MSDKETKGKVVIKWLLICLTGYLMVSYIKAVLVFVATLAVLSVILKPVRFYILSYGFPWLYDHPSVARMAGIKYVDDDTFKPNRTDTRIYLDGVFAWMFSTFITGMPIVTPEHTRKELMALQGQFAKKITMKEYFKDIVGKQMRLDQFEDFLSEKILLETNRVFEIVNEKEKEAVGEHMKMLRVILAGLTGGENRSVWTFINGIKHVRSVMKILKSVSPAKRLLLLIPHLSLIDGFSKMLCNTRGKTSGLQMNDFFDYTSKFFVVVHKGDLTFIRRSKDMTNSGTNRAFGVLPGFFCPGSTYVIKFIKSILEFLRCMDISVEGEPVIDTQRFRVVTNKKDISVTFKGMLSEYDEANTEDTAVIGDFKESDVKT